MTDIKQCPYCAEDIKAAAIVCKHCGREQPDYDSKIAEIIKSPVEDSAIKKRKAQKKPPVKKQPASNTEAISFATYWQRSGKLGIIIALLSIVAIPAGRLGIYNTISDSPSAQQAFLGNIATLTVTGTILNYLIARLSYSSVAWVWSKPSNRPIIGILALVAFLLSSGVLSTENLSSQSQQEATYTPWGSSATVGVSQTPGNSINESLSTAAVRARTQEAASPEQQFILDNNCISHSEINTGFLGQSLCVFGTVVLDFWNQGCAWDEICPYDEGDDIVFSLYTVNFSANQSMVNHRDFRFTSQSKINVYNYLVAYEDIVKNAVSWQDLLAPGHCVAALGEISYFRNWPFLTIDLSAQDTTLYWLSDKPCEK